MVKLVSIILTQTLHLVFIAVLEAVPIPICVSKSKWLPLFVLKRNFENAILKNILSFFLQNKKQILSIYSIFLKYILKNPIGSDFLFDF